MIDPNTPIACLTVGQFMELQKLESRKPKASSIELPKYLSPKQLADLVGWAKQTVYQNHHNGKIPGARKIQGRLRPERKGLKKSKAIKIDIQKNRRA